VLFVDESTAWARRSRRSSIRRSRTSGSTSSSARDLPRARSGSSCRRFTLVGATTRAGLISPPLRARFGIVHRLDFYPPAELARILIRSSSILGIAGEPEGLAEIAGRSRGTRASPTAAAPGARLRPVAGRKSVDRDIARTALAGSRSTITASRSSIAGCCRP